MDVGIVTFPTAASLAPDRLGAAVEEAGFESLFVCEPGGSTPYVRP